MTAPLPEPGDQRSDARGLFLDYLDYYRSAVATKLDGLSEQELRTSRLPSGWTPIELLKHILYVERRWLVWGFAGEDVDEPWGDNDENGRWSVAADETVGELVQALHAGGVRTREIVEAGALSTRGTAGGRFDDQPPALVWILFHLLQEYARHAGHLDIVRELTDGVVGE